MFYRRFGKYSFQDLEGLKFQNKQTQKQMTQTSIALKFKYSDKATKFEKISCLILILFVNIKEKW